MNLSEPTGTFGTEPHVGSEGTTIAINEEADPARLMIEEEYSDDDDLAPNEYDLVEDVDQSLLNLSMNLELEGDSNGEEDDQDVHRTIVKDISRGDVYLEIDELVAKDLLDDERLDDEL